MFAGVVVLGVSVARAQSAVFVPDADGDGLVYEQEKVIGTSPDLADTDGDGISDLEELARHTSPIYAASVPNLGKQFGIGMTVHAENDGLHALTCVFMADTNLRTKNLTMGFMAGNRMAILSSDYIVANSTVSFHTSAISSGCVVVIDTHVDPAWVIAMGEFAVFAKGSDGLGPFGFDIVHMVNINGVVAYAMPMPQPMAAPVMSYGGVLEGRGTIYVPLLPTPDSGGGGSGTGGTDGSGPGGGGSGSTPATIVNSTWSQGEVCFQRSSFVGSDGANVTNEIIAAECLSGWDGFCPPSCTSTVGSTFRTVDPLVLLGG